MVHIQTVVLTLLLAAASGMDITEEAAEELYNWFINGVFTFPVDCSQIEISCSNISYILYNQENQQNGILLNSTNLNEIDTTNRVIFIIHGSFENGKTTWVSEMIEAYLKQGSENVIVVDYGAYSLHLPSVLICRAPKIGKCVGEFILSTGIDPKNVQIYAFSLGCQIAGSAGLEVQKKADGAKIEKINCCEAAGPGFLNVSLDERLDASDASCVQAMHTNRFGLGYPYPYGTIDFYLNCLGGCGKWQPGCPLITGIPFISPMDLANILICHHVRCNAYFIESITSNNFIGAECDSCTSFCHGCCSFEPTAIMGESYTCSATGVHYLNTNVKPPFAKGLDGIPEFPWFDFFNLCF